MKITTTTVVNVPLRTDVQHGLAERREIRLELDAAKNGTDSALIGYDVDMRTGITLQFNGSKSEPFVLGWISAWCPSMPNIADFSDTL